MPDEWRLPTSTQLQEMLRQQINGGYDFGINEEKKYHCSYDEGMNKSRIYWIEGGQIKYSNGTGNKNVPAYIRFVRRQNL